MKIRWLGEKKADNTIHLEPGDSITCSWHDGKKYNSFTQKATTPFDVNTVGIFEAEDWEGFKLGIGGFFGEK